jgi:hypothetical protein
MTRLAEFKELERTLNAIMGNLKSSEQRKVLKAIGMRLRRSQHARIAAQKNPDGSAYRPRQKKLKSKRVLSATKFIYPSHGSGEPRLVFMKQWVFLSKRRIAGFDIESGSMRTFLRQKIIQFLPVSASDQNKWAGQMRRPTVKDKLMFKKIRGPRFLKSSLDAEELSVGFSGRVARIGLSHQEGKDHHPVRELIGATDHDIEELMDAVIDMMET